MLVKKAKPAINIACVSVPLTIGIMGVGMVGGAIARYFASKSERVFLYDKYRDNGSINEINKADIIFICVPTPFERKKGFDISAVEEAFGLIKGNKIIILKSTVWPGTTDKLQKKYARHRILFNPEFLSEATAEEDFRIPDIQIVGFTATSRSLAPEILKILPKAPFQKIIPAIDAETFKYFHNAHGAIKVVFANQMYDLCANIGVDYKNILDCAAASKNIRTAQYLNVWHKKFRGYGGSCFPKDIKALIQFGDKKGVNLQLLKSVEKINSALLAKQGIKNPEKIR